MTPLQHILATYRSSSMTEREKGTYFEKLIRTYLRQFVLDNTPSGITNDANFFPTKTVGNPKYPLELFLQVVTVSLQTNQKVKSFQRWILNNRIEA
jgi:predicted helicase